MLDRTPGVSVAEKEGGARGRAADDVLLALYSQHSGPLRAWVATRVRRSDIDDVCQEVWVRVFRAYATQFDGTNFRAWLFAIARNYITAQSKKKGASVLDDSVIHPAAPAEQDPSWLAARREFRRCLAECIAALGQPRQALVEGRLSGADYDELAPALRLTSQQAFTQFFNAKKALRACMHSKYPGGWL